MEEILQSDYEITKEARKLLATPMGDLLVGTIAENKAKLSTWLKENVDAEEYTLIPVGDVVTDALLNHEELVHKIKMCVFDRITKRKEYTINTTISSFNEVQITNPSGIIAKDASIALKKYLERNETYLVEVIGEEDLLVIPIVLFAKPNTLIIYGQPPITDIGQEMPAGMVILKNSQEIKNKIHSILQTFKQL